MQYKTQYGTIFAVKEHNGAPAIMCRAELSETWSPSSMIEPFTPGAWTAEALQGQLDSWAATKGWQPVEEPASVEPPETADEGGEPEDGFPDWVRPMVEAFLQFDFVRELPAFTTAAFKNSESVRHHWGGSLANGLYDTGPKGIKFSVFRGPNSDQYREASYTWAGFVRRCRAAGLEPGLREKEEPPRPRPGDVYRAPKSGQLYKIGELTNGKKTCYLTMRSNAQGGTWVPVNSSVYPKLSDAQGEFEAWIRTERLEPVAPTGAAAATTDGSAAPEPPQAAGTTTTSASGAVANSCGTPAPAAQPSSEPPAELAPTAPMNLPAFDYSGLDEQTVQDLHLAEREVSGGKRMAEMGLRRMADGVAIAHDALCGSCDKMSQLKHGNRGEASFGRWCESVGLNRKAAERLLQVSKLFDNSTPREQKVLDELGPSLLYAAAKPSAPHELVQAVKNRDITTHKQYQEALAEIRARDAKINDLLEMSEAADRRADKAEQAAKDTARERDAALRRAAEAENRAAGAQKLAEQRGNENTELKARIRDMENQPRDVAVVQPGEAQIEAWRKEGETRAAAALRDSIRKADQAKADAQRQVNALQDQLAAAVPDADACQRTADTLYETTENLRLLLRTQLKLAQLPPKDYGNVVAHVLQAADALRDTVRSCAPAGYTMDDEEDDFL